MAPCIVFIDEARKLPAFALALALAFLLFSIELINLRCTLPHLSKLRLAFSSRSMPSVLAPVIP